MSGSLAWYVCVCVCLWQTGFCGLGREEISLFDQKSDVASKKPVFCRAKKNQDS